ncbi:hypothetical protein [Sorangium sp. So ce233]|uniref:hypothetical protein n=1 Tax=Sorangium sp. So ce233 TaxID=3133290 RepID=UPI003F62FA6B
MKFPWEKLGTLLAEVAIAVVGALLVDRVSKPAQRPTPTPPTPRPPDNVPPRADNEITATGHANIDARFRPAPAPAGTAIGRTDKPSGSQKNAAQAAVSEAASGAPHPPTSRTVPITEPSPPLPGSALHGHEPPDADPTEPDAHEPIGPRDMQ